MATIEIDKVVRFLENEADTCLVKDCSRCNYARELARRIVNGELKKPVPLSAGRGCYVPKIEQFLIPSFLDECKREGLPDPIRYLPGIISWAKEERILKKDWFEFAKVMLRKQKAKDALQPVKKPVVFKPQEPRRLTVEERQRIAEKLKNNA